MKVLTIFSGHDASATIVKDGEIEYYFKEERYNKKKHSGGHKFIFDIIFHDFLDDIDYVIFASSDRQENKNKKDQLIKSKNIGVKFLDPTHQHHLFHASGAFYTSGFEKSLVICIDSAGGYQVDPEVFECDSVYVAEYPCKFTPLYKRYWTANFDKRFDKISNGCRHVSKHASDEINIGNLYNSAALVIGQTIDDCGKAMGLSSYGSSVSQLKFFGERISGINAIKKYFKKYPKLLDYMIDFKDDAKYTMEITQENYQFFANYCYEVQRQCQDQVFNLVEKYVNETGIKRVCIAGGYGMNIITNYELLKRFGDVEFYFDPMCDDSGLSIGASMYVYRKLTGDSRIIPFKDTFFHGLKHDVSQYRGEFADEKTIAKLLYDNKSVAVYNHLAEAGQRALGNRSILFNALNPDAKDIVNKIKNREWYRPFAAIVLEEDAHLYFDDVIPNPYMTVCFPVKTDLIPGVTHVDNTCRIQTVNSGHLYSILKEFKDLTGHGILLNTSFNLAGEPLVETPQDAFRTLRSSSLDYLWFYETKQLFNFTF
jgi:carbamoyltransferase